MWSGRRLAVWFEHTGIVCENMHALGANLRKLPRQAKICTPPGGQSPRERLRKFASPTPAEWANLRKYAMETTRERIAKICAPPKSYYPRMHWESPPATTGQRQPASLAPARSGPAPWSQQPRTYLPIAGPKSASLMLKNPRGNGRDCQPAQLAGASFRRAAPPRVPGGR